MPAWKISAGILAGGETDVKQMMMMELLTTMFSTSLAVNMFDTN